MWPISGLDGSCPCGHQARREPDTRWDAVALAYHQNDIGDMLVVVESDDDRWLRVLRCLRCDDLWAEDTMSSGHADLSFIYPIQTSDPRSWLDQARPLDLPMRDTPVLRFIGYWSSPDDPEWPDATAFVDQAIDPHERERVVDYLRAGTAFVTAAGPVSCRLCDAPNGCAEITDGRHLVWPEGLAHYVEAHDVRLPAEVVEQMHRPPSQADARAFTRDLFRAGRVIVDYEWWRRFGQVRGGKARLLKRRRVHAPDSRA